MKKPPSPYTVEVNAIELKLLTVLRATQENSFNVLIINDPLIEPPTRKVLIVWPHNPLFINLIFRRSRKQ